MGSALVSCLLFSRQPPWAPGTMLCKRGIGNEQTCHRSGSRRGRPDCPRQAHGQTHPIFRPLLPPGPPPWSFLWMRMPAGAGEYLPLLDGLLVPGGEDICPSFYGQSPVPQVVYTYADKDRMDLALVRMAAEAGLPVFGICRVCRSSTCVWRHPYSGLALPTPGSLVHTSDKDTLRTHEARLVPGSLMERLLGNEPLMVNTYHHQAVTSWPPVFSITRLC